MFVKIFFGLFSATFCQILSFYGLQFFPAINNFLGPLLSYLAENSAIWHQWSMCATVYPHGRGLSGYRLLGRRGTNVVFTLFSHGWVAEKSSMTLPAGKIQFPD
jgi:hypothetical protein